MHNGCQFGSAVNGHEYVDLGLPSGLLWATCNVGASSPQDYGNYYAWGETTTKSTYSWDTYKWCNGSEYSLTKYNTYLSSYGYVDHRTTLEPADDVARWKWGGRWRIPTQDEKNELREKCTWTWTTQNGVNGMKVKGPNGKSIFLPAAGYYSGSSQYTGYNYYWSSSLCPNPPSAAYRLYFDSGGVYDDSYVLYRYCGTPVRPVCN